LQQVGIKQIGRHFIELKDLRIRSDEKKLKFYNSMEVINQKGRIKKRTNEIQQVKTNHQNCQSYKSERSE